MGIENNYTVYMHISPSNKRYIGITKQYPKKRWQNGKGYEHNEYFTNAINKYGWDNFEHIIIAKGLTEDEAKWLEIELIREWDSTNREKGYNRTLGGESANGLVFSEEWREEHSKRMSGENNPMFGKHHAEETKQKLSEVRIEKGLAKGENNPMFGVHRYGEEAPMFGKQHSEETKQKISEANKGNDYFKGKHHTEETKQKLSEMMSGENNPTAKTVILLNTKEVFPTVREGAKKYNVPDSNICACCNKNKKNKSAGKHPVTNEKLIWMYYEDYLKLIDNK